MDQFFPLHITWNHLVMQIQPFLRQTSVEFVSWNVCRWSCKLNKIAAEIYTIAERINFSSARYFMVPCKCKSFAKLPWRLLLLLLLFSLCFTRRRWCTLNVYSLIYSPSSPSSSGGTGKENQQTKDF